MFSNAFNENKANKSNALVSFVAFAPRPWPWPVLSDRPLENEVG